MESRFHIIIPAKPESSVFMDFWMPDQVRHDGISELMDGLYLFHP
jgi:hypothetical protein